MNAKIFELQQRKMKKDIIENKCSCSVNNQHVNYVDDDLKVLCDDASLAVAKVNKYKVYMRINYYITLYC